jgi:hypothetical protein
MGEKWIIIENHHRQDLQQHSENADEPTQQRAEYPHDINDKPPRAAPWTRVTVALQMIAQTPRSPPPHQNENVKRKTNEYGKALPIARSHSTLHLVLMSCPSVACGYNVSLAPAPRRVAVPKHSGLKLERNNTHRSNYATGRCHSGAKMQPEPLVAAAVCWSSDPQNSGSHVRMGWCGCRRTNARWGLEPKGQRPVSQHQAINGRAKRAATNSSHSARPGTHHIERCVQKRPEGFDG